MVVNKKSKLIENKIEKSENNIKILMERTNKLMHPKRTIKRKEVNVHDQQTRGDDLLPGHTKNSSIITIEAKNEDPLIAMPHKKLEKLHKSLTKIIVIKFKFTILMF